METLQGNSVLGKYYIRNFYKYSNEMIIGFTVTNSLKIVSSRFSITQSELAEVDFSSSKTRENTMRSLI